MRLSRYFLPILKENPREAEIVSHRLMLRAGMIRQQGQGSFSWLPLGKRVLDKVCRIVREEQNRAGALEILMPTIQSAELWRESGRYDDYGKEMLRIKDRQDRDMLFGPTNEEMVTEIFRSYVRSYKDLPLNLYHIQWKYRDEVRPRFGVMRSREFLMKDAYSFDLDYEGAKAAYNRMFVSYLRTFTRMGLQAIPMRADTGPIGGDLSHEFIILADTGESQVFCDRRLVEMPAPGANVDWDDLQGIVDERTSMYAATEEMHDATRFEGETSEDQRLTARGIEVGQRKRRHQEFDGAGADLLLAHDLLDLLQHPKAQRQPGVDPRRLLPDQAGAKHELVRDDLGVRRRLFEGGKEVARQAHGENPANRGGAPL